MNFRPRKSYLLLLLLLLPSLAYSAKEPTTISLIKAWENIRATEQNTIVFRNISNNLYEYETNHFPYKGQIKITSAEINSYFRGDDGSFRMGTVNAELVNISNEMRQKYQREYGEWYLNNNLAYDMNRGKWITLLEYNELSNNTNQRGVLMRIMSPEILGVLILVLLVYVFLFIKKSRQNAVVLMDRHSKSMVQIDKSMELSQILVKANEETNELLRAILNELKTTKRQ